MADSNMILAKSELEGEVGDFLGWGRGLANSEEDWDAFKKRDIASILKSAQNRVYTQAQLDPNGPVHSWTFLTPGGTAALHQGDPYAVLPEDFGYLAGEIAVSAPSSGYWPIRLDNIDRVRALYARTTTPQTGRPCLAAEEEVAGVTLDRSSRARLYVYPTPDADYTLRFSYSVIPALISDATPFPYGGAAHALTFKAACRAAAELYKDTRQGPEEANYRMCLAASIAYDRRRKPQVMAYNADYSDMIDSTYARRDRNWWGHLSMPTATVGGLDPG